MTWILLAHVWGDYILQTDRQAAAKTRCWWAMSRHLAGYHLPMTLAALGSFGPTWRPVVFIVVSAVTHAVIDRRWPVVRLIRATGSPGFAATSAGVHIVDQVLHVTVLTAAYTALT